MKAYPIFMESIHFTLDITKEDGTRSINVPVGWCNKRDGKLEIIGVGVLTVSLMKVRENP